MISEFESKVLEKLETLDIKIDRLDSTLNEKIDRLDVSLNKKIDGVYESLSDKIDYLTNNVAIILQEQIKMREEMQKYNEQNEKEHRLFEYEINNLKRLVV